MDLIEKSAWNRAWDSILVRLGIRKVPGTNHGLGDVLYDLSMTGGATEAAMDLYVSATGSDLNDGSVSSPFLTIQKAIDSVPKRIKHPVTINVGAGTFDGFVVDGFTLVSEIITSSGQFRFLGTYASATVSSGPTSGIATSAVVGSTYTTSWGSLTLAGAGWTVNDLKGKWLRIVGGGGYAASANERVIVSNTADTISVAGGLPSGVAAGTQFELVESSTKVRSNAPSYGSFYQASGAYTAGSASVCATIRNCVGSCILVMSRLEFITTGVTTSGSFSGLMVRGNAISISAYNCRWTNLAFPVNASAPYTAVMNVAYSYVVADAGYSHSRFMFPGGAAYGAVLASSFVDVTGWGVDSMGGNLQVYGSLLNLSGTNNGIYTSAQMEFLGCKLLRPTAGASLFLSGLSGAGTYTASKTGGGKINVTDCDISNITTVLNATGATTAVTFSGVTGTGNTTVINASNGANVYIKSTTTITGTTEISIDGVAKTLAEMRANTPKYLTNATTGTRVWGD